MTVVSTTDEASYTNPQLLETFPKYLVLALPSSYRLAQPDILSSSRNDQDSHPTHPSLSTCLPCFK